MPSVPPHITGAKTASNDYIPANRLALLHSGSDYFDLLERYIAQAQQEIHLQFYIFNDDQAGKRIATAIISAAKKGVKIYLLMDGYEARSLSKDFIRSISVPNLQWQFFEPLFRSKHFYIGRRLHHKIAVFDQRIALVGGINIADRYLGNENKPAWLDLAISIEGGAVAAIYEVCRSYWNDAVETAFRLGEPATLTRQATSGDCSVRVRRNDWVKGQNQIWKSYFDLFNQADERILVMCSYFLPGWIFLNLIKKAIARGVRVQVILAGISDVPLAKHAERYLYRWMLRNGVELYEYKGSVLHAKVGIRDDRWLSIGSYNVNNISALASIELNVDVRNKAFVSEVVAVLEEVISKSCLRITPEQYHATQNLVKQLWQWVCYQVIKMVLFLATFYFRREI